MPDRKFIEIKVSTGNSKAQVDALDKSMVSLGKDADDTSKSMGALSKAAVAVASAISVQQVIAFADAWTTVNNKLANSIRANETLADVTQRVFDIAQNTRSSLDATAGLYAKLERATRDYGTSAQEIAALTKTINQAFIVSGATVQEAETAITQLGQGLAAGALRGDEFNTVNENGNRIIVALAASLGKTTGEMRELASQNALTTEVIVNGLLKQSKVIENEYNKTVTTFAQQTQVATQNLTKFIGESTTVQGVVAVAGDAIVTASESLDLLIDAATAMTLLYVARLTPSVAAYVTSIYAQITAQTKATVTTNYLGQRVVVATAATNAAALATRAYATSLAALGGPAGVVTIALAGIVALLAASRDTTNQMGVFAQKTREAEEALKGLTRAQKENKLLSIEQELLAASQSMNGLKEKADAAFKALTSQIATGRESGLVILQQQAEAAQKAIKDAEGQILSLAAQASALRGAGGLGVARPSADAGNQATSTFSSSAKTGDLARLADSSYSARYIAGEVASTEALAQELQNRVVLFEQFTTQINAIQDDTFAKEKLRLEATEFEQISSANLQLQNRLAAIEQERALLLENDSLTFEARTELALQFDEQEIIARQTHEQILTEVSEEGAEARRRIAEAERNFNIGLAAGAFNDLLGLAQGHSRKAFELAKAGAIGTAVIKGYDAAVAAWDAGMSTGGPWAPAVAAAYTAASLLKTGALIKGISGAKYGSGSQTAGTGGVSTPTPSTGGAASSPSQTGNLRAPTQIFDLRGITADSLVTGQALIDILTSTTGVAVALDGVMQEGRRLGEIS